MKWGIIIKKTVLFFQKKHLSSKAVQKFCVSCFFFKESESENLEKNILDKLFCNKKNWDRNDKKVAVQIGNSSKKA